MTSYYETNEPAGNVNVYFNCGAGEHQVLFLAKADGPPPRWRLYRPGARVAVLAAGEDVTRQGVEQFRVGLVVWVHRGGVALRAASSKPSLARTR